LFAPSTWEGWILLTTVSGYGTYRKVNLTLQLPELWDVTKGFVEGFDTTLVKVLQEFFDARVILGALH